MKIEAKELTTQGIVHDLPSDFEILSLYYNMAGNLIVDVSGDFDGSLHAVSFKWVSTGEDVPTGYTHGTSEGNTHVFYQ